MITADLSVFVEKAARNILRAAGRTWVDMDSEWQADVARYREMCAKFPDYAKGSSELADAFRSAEAAFAALSLDEAEAVAWTNSAQLEANALYPGAGYTMWGARAQSRDIPLFTHPTTGTRDEVLRLREKVNAVWCGDSHILEPGWEVEVLASDPDGCMPRGGPMTIPARTACWIRYWPENERFPMYRSCDLADLELSDKDFAALASTGGDE